MCAVIIPLPFMVLNPWSSCLSTPWVLGYWHGLQCVWIVSNFNQAFPLEEVAHTPHLPEEGLGRNGLWSIQHSIYLGPEKSIPLRKSGKAALFIFSTERPRAQSTWVESQHIRLSCCWLGRWSSHSEMEWANLSLCHNKILWLQGLNNKHLFSLIQDAQVLNQGASRLFVLSRPRSCSQLCWNPLCANMVVKGICAVFPHQGNLINLIQQRALPHDLITSLRAKMSASWGLGTVNLGKSTQSAPEGND